MYQARIVMLSLSLLAGGLYSVSMELSGEGTPPVFAEDGVRLELTRVEPAEGSPKPAPDEGPVLLNAVVTEVHNNAPSNALLVNLRVLGCAGELPLFEGDGVKVNLTVVSQGSAGQAPGNPPPPGGSTPLPQPVVV